MNYIDNKYYFQKSSTFGLQNTKQITLPIDLIDKVISLYTVKTNKVQNKNL